MAGFLAAGFLAAGFLVFSFLGEDFFEFFFWGVFFLDFFAASSFFLRAAIFFAPSSLVNSPDFTKDRIFFIQASKLVSFFALSCFLSTANFSLACFSVILPALTAALSSLATASIFFCFFSSALTIVRLLRNMMDDIIVVMNFILGCILLTFKCKRLFSVKN